LFAFVPFGERPGHSCSARAPLGARTFEPFVEGCASVDKKSIEQITAIECERFLMATRIERFAERSGVGPACRWIDADLFGPAIHDRAAPNFPSEKMHGGIE